RSGRISVSPRSLTVADWLDRHRPCGRLRERLWEPLTRAALNQAPGSAPAEPFVRVRAEMFGPDSVASAHVLPAKPLHLMYAEPARAFIESRGGSIRTNALARVRVDGGGVTGVSVRGDFVACRRVIAAVPWFGLRTLFPGQPPDAMTSIVQAAERMESMPIVTVNLWYDRMVMDEPFVALPGRSMQWVFDKRLAFGSKASHLSLVASGAEELVDLESGALVARAAAEVAGALPGA